MDSETPDMAETVDPTDRDVVLAALEKLRGERAPRHWHPRARSWFEALFELPQAAAFGSMHVELAHIAGEILTRWLNTAEAEPALLGMWGQLHNQLTTLPTPPGPAP